MICHDFKRGDWYGFAARLAAPAAAMRSGSAGAGSPTTATEALPRVDGVPVGPKSAPTAPCPGSEPHGGSIILWSPPAPLDRFGASESGPAGNGRLSTEWAGWGITAAAMSLSPLLPTITSPATAEACTISKMLPHHRVEPVFPKPWPKPLKRPHSQCFNRC